MKKKFFLWIITILFMSYDYFVSADNQPLYYNYNDPILIEVKNKAVSEFEKKYLETGEPIYKRIIEMIKNWSVLDREAMIKDYKITSDFVNYKPLDVKKPEKIYYENNINKDDVNNLIKNKWTCSGKNSEDIVNDEMSRLFYTYINYVNNNPISQKNLSLQEKYDFEKLQKEIDRNKVNYKGTLEELLYWKSAIADVNKVYTKHRNWEYALELLDKEIQNVKDNYKFICEELEGKKTTNIEKKEEIKTIETTRNPEFERVDKVLNELYIQYWSRLFSIIPALEKLKTTDKYKNKIDLLDHIIQKINSFKR